MHWMRPLSNRGSQLIEVEKFQNPLLVIPPDLRTEGLFPGLDNSIAETTKAIDEIVPPIKPQPDLESSIVVPHPGQLLKHPSPLHGIWA